MNDAVDSNPSAAPGRRLADARQAQNLAPADIARQLKLSVWQVEALESGNYAQLPGPVFVRGFIRNYARLVKLDSNELLRTATEVLPQDALRPEAPPSPEIPFPGTSRPRWPLFGAAVAVMVTLLVAYEFYWNEPETQVVSTDTVKSRPEKAEVAAPSPAQAAVAAGQAPATQDATAQSAKSGPVAAAPQAGNDAPVPVAAEPNPGRELKRGERRVKLAFAQESWVEIRDRDERIIFSQLNRPGTEQLVQGVPPFSVVVGNAHGVRLTYEDRQVDLAPHTKIDVARLILE